MHHFSYRTKDGTELLHAENVDLEALARDVGTPFYCYSQATLERHYRVFDEAFAAIPHIVCYSVKANSNLAILNLFAKAGSGFDIVSGGELKRALAAGGDAGKVVFSGVGKTETEIRQAIAAGILLFNIESEAELELVNQIALGVGKKVSIALRVNPDIDPKTHPYISTGLRKAKFGIDLGYARKLFDKARKLAGLDVAGVDCHIGSQMTELAPVMEALESLSLLIGDLRKEGHDIRYLDIGGGLGITYRAEAPPHPAEYAKLVIPEIRKLNVTLLLEPGRVIVGNAGILVSRVLYTKNSAAKNFVIADAGMNDLIRPALYQAHQEIWPVRQDRKKQIKADLVGPICESGDFLALDRDMPEFKSGDLLAVMSAGAYGFSMSSTYNTRPRVPEVLIDGESYHVVRDRESVKTLMRGEKIPGLKGAFRLPFVKMHGLGNDFVVIDGRFLKAEKIDWPRVAQRLSDRHFGVGADQVLIVEKSTLPTADLGLSIYDADGTQVEMCGNGLRAVALYALEEGLVHASPVRVALPDRIATVAHRGGDTFRVDMGAPVLEGEKIPTTLKGSVINQDVVVANHQTLKFTAVSMGNPHAVIFIDDKVADFPVREYGRALEVNAIFPKRVNVEFVELLSPTEVNARVWERGAGETLACGSGACAIVVAGVLSHRTGRQLNVKLPGGTLACEWVEATNHVLMTGEAKRVFEGDIDLKELLEGKAP